MKRKFSIPRVSVFLAPVVVIALGYVGWRMFFGGTPAEDKYVLFTAERTTLPIVVTERGSLESQIETAIRCEVENIAVSRNSQSGTQIIYLIPNGSAVKEGDLLVELDSSPIREMLDEQVITYERAKAEQIQSQARYDNQITQNETSIADADLNIELSQLELDMFMDEENGTHKLDMDDILRQIDQINSDVLEAQARLELTAHELEGVEALFDLGYKGKSDLDEKRLQFLQAEGNLAVALNRLETMQATLRKVEAYEKRMSQLRFEGNLANAIRERQQVEVDNRSNLTQAEAALDAANRALEKEDERLVRLRAQLERCMIYAPHDGMVVYARSRDFSVEEGAHVRERQRLISLPDLGRMQVETYIHESVLDQVKPGLKVEVRVDAFSDRYYEGTVESVAVVPADRGWSGGDVKMYETIVTIDGMVDQLKPGMTAVVDINIDRLENVITVPIQAIVQRRNVSRCYVYNGRHIELREVKLGLTNDKHVQIVSGIEEGEQVVLNPMSFFDDEEELEAESQDAIGNEGLDDETQIAEDGNSGTRTASRDQTP